MQATGHFLGECMGQNGGYPCAVCGVIISSARRETDQREQAARTAAESTLDKSPQDDTETTPDSVST